MILKFLRNNESVKHFDKSSIKNIDYVFHNNTEEILYKRDRTKNFSSLNLLNGYLNNIDNIDSEKFSIRTLNQYPDLAEEKIKIYQDVILEDYLINLNSVLFNSGYDLELKKNTSNKIFINHNINQLNTTIFAKNFITANENSNLILIEKHMNKVKSNSNIINYIKVEKNARVVHLIIQDNDIDSKLQLSTHVNCLENSSYSQNIFNTSNGTSRNHHYANLNGINAKAELQGVFFWFW